jgi:hypothetical protein
MHQACMVSFSIYYCYFVLPDASMGFHSREDKLTKKNLGISGGCPVIKGNKWSSTKWIRVSEYRT